MIVKDLLSRCATDEIVAEIMHISGADVNKRVFYNQIQQYLAVKRYMENQRGGIA